MIDVYANEITTYGYRDEYTENSNYDAKGFVDTTRPVPCGEEAIGTLKLEGKITEPELPTIGGKPSYYVDSGEISFSYNLKESFVNAQDTEWHIVNDDGKKVDEITLTEKIGKGAIIIESSIDGKNWHVDKAIINIINGNLNSIYTAKEIQISNGCYYRVTVAYKVARNTGKKETLAFWNNKYEYKKYKEEYSFYLQNKDLEKPASNKLSFDIGKTTNTGKDNGFSGYQKIDNKDPHLGWDLGQFKISGYTETMNKNNKTVFLKNAGDQVLLSFRLLQDINKLNGNNNLSISRDWNGYDTEFGIEETDMGRGFLIIQFTDSNNKTTVEKYQNYLEANTTTTADTRVGLYEEGDYKVALDYEIKKKKNIGEEYYNYKISFDFSVRNGNCMIFPFDVKTKKELNNESYTPNGFKIDWAKSRYLTIEVQYSTLVKGPNGLVEDVRYYRPSKDGDEYTEPGIYRLTIINDYLSRPINKTLYVGDVGYIKALSKTGLSVDELNSMLLEGATVTESGEIVQPVATDEEIIVETTETIRIASEEPIIEKNENNAQMETSKDIQEDVNNHQEENSNISTGVIAVFFVLMVAIVGMLTVRRKH